jgi:cytochrome c-type biogenesis protein CcmE
MRKIKMSKRRLEFLLKWAMSMSTRITLTIYNSNKNKSLNYPKCKYNKRLIALL